MYNTTFKSKYAQERGFATPLMRASQLRSAYADDILDRPYLAGGLQTEARPLRGVRSTSLLTHLPIAGPVHHEISPNKVGYHNEYEVKTIEHEPVTRIETVPITKQIQVPVTHMESKEVAETIQVPVTLMEPRSELRTEMVPVTIMKDKEVRWTERVPVTTMEE